MAPPSCCVQDISELFNLDLFIKQKPTIERSFYKTFCDTQTFTSFIEQRSFSHAESNALGFFDECTEKVQLTVTTCIAYKYSLFLSLSLSFSFSLSQIIADSNAKLLNIDAIVHRFVSLIECSYLYNNYIISDVMIFLLWSHPLQTNQVFHKESDTGIQSDYSSFLSISPFLNLISSYPFFPALDPTLFHSPLTSSTKSPYQKTPTPTRLTSQSSLVNMAVRTQAEKAKSKAVSMKMLYY